MNSIRFALSILAILALGLGYFASQSAFWSGRAPEYAAAVDTPVVRALAATLLGAAVVFALIKDRARE